MKYSYFFLIIFISTISYSQCGDTIDPTASNPSPINVECISDIPGPDPLVVTDEADNSGVPPVVTFDNEMSDGNTCPETITRTYTITDTCGNFITVTQTITVDDITVPTASDPDTTFVISIADVPAANPAVVIDEADNCTVNPVVSFVSEVPGTSYCPEIIERTYSVQDDCGNIILVTHIIVIGPDPTFSISGDSLIADTPYQYQYQWLDCDNGMAPITGAIDSIFVPTSPGNYALEATAYGSSGTCTDTSDCQYFSPSEIRTFNKTTFEVYPNPAYNIVYVSPQSNSIYNLSILDLNGKTICIENNCIGQSSINVSELEKGTYILRILTDGDIENQILVVQ